MRKVRLFIRQLMSFTGQYLKWVSETVLIHHYLLYYLILSLELLNL